MMDNFGAAGRSGGPRTLEREPTASPLEDLETAFRRKSWLGQGRAKHVKFTEARPRTRSGFLSPS